MYDFLDDAVFPRFRKFTIKDITPYKRFYEITCAPYADISPANLLVWFDINHTLEIARLDNAVVLRYDNPFDNGAKNYIILEKDVSAEHVRAIYSLPGDKTTTRIKEQPANFTQSIAHDKKTLLEDNIDSYEYILDTNLLANLKGGRISRLREEVNHFRRNNTGITVQHMTSFSDQEKLRLNAILNGWNLTVHPDIKNSHAPNLERNALKIAIALADTLERQIMVVSVADKPVGLAIYAVYGDTAIIGHVKVDYEFKSVFSYTTHRLAQLLLGAGVNYMNFEQDLGLEGLRYHKSLLRPVKMLKKVDIRLLDS